MLSNKTALVMVRVTNETGTDTVVDPAQTVVLHRKIYTIKRSGSGDKSSSKVPELDCPGVSKKAHIEINAKM